MIRKVRKYIEEQNLLPVSAKIIIGLSGGADSVVLLHILHHLGYNCIAAHCNFHLRGEESARDEKLAEKLAFSYQIPFEKIDFNTIETAKKQGISIEMAARELRYNWFAELQEKQNADFIAVAHHQDDNIETFLLNLIRGTGIKGLTGIQPKNGKVVRPLLTVSKQEILDFAKENNLSFVTDSSNLQDEHTRNKIRLSVIPLLQKINPSVHSSILRTIENLTETQKVYAEKIDEEKKEIFNPQKGIIDIDKLKNTSSPSSVLFEILKDYGFNYDNIKKITRAIDGLSGKEFYSEKFILSKNRSQFILSSKKENEDKQTYTISKESKKIEIPLNIEIDYILNEKDFLINKAKEYAYFDANKLTFPLQIRKWEPGDKFMPLGMNGFQKLSDYFNNQKFSKQEKENTWLLCSKKDIVWIIGHRTDNRYRIEKSTKKVCFMKLLSGSTHLISAKKKLSIESKPN